MQLNFFLMRDYIPEQFKNHDQSIIEIETLIKSVNNNLLTIGNDYINKITGIKKIDGKIEYNHYYGIRNSIELRIQSIVFHYRLVNSIHNPNKSLTPNIFPPLGLESISIHQKFLFDSIVFHLISAFDYLASLINLIIIKNKDSWEKTWNELERIARMKPLLNQTKLGLIIRNVDNDWLKNLNEYRSELIHYQTESLGFDTTVNVRLGTGIIVVHAPTRMKNKFRQLKKITENSDCNINSVSLWLIKTSLEVILEIQVGIIEYIEEYRIIPEEKAIYSIEKKTPPKASI